MPEPVTVAALGVAIGKVLLRWADLNDTADAVADAHAGFDALRSILHSRKAREPVSAAITEKLQQQLKGVKHPKRQEEMKIAVTNVAVVFTGLSDDDIRAAAQHPDGFPEYLMHGPGRSLLNQTEAAITPFTETLMTVGAEVFAQLAPRSGRFTAGALLRLLDQVDAAVTDAANTRAEIAAARAELVAATDRIGASVQALHPKVDALLAIGWPGPDRLAVDESSAKPPPSGLDRTALAKAARESLGAPPAYYPVAFTTADLAADLAVASFEVQTREFGGHSLYWDSHLHGSPEVIGEVLTANPLTVILGNPGAGKTTLAKHLALQRLHQHDAAAYARLDDLGNRLEGGASTYDLDAGLSAVAEAMSHAIRASVDPSFLACEPGQTAPLIVLDGLDEVPSASGRDEVHRLATLLTDHGYTVVITSRISGYSAPWAEAAHLAVQPLADSAAARFAERWFALTGDDVARQRYATAASNPEIALVLENPLTLGFVCFVASRDDIPATAAAIFERFVDHFIRRTWHDPAHWITDGARVAAIMLAATDLAWAMSCVPHGAYQQRWIDLDTLANLEELTSSVDTPYTVYDAGLLIAHGSISPTSERYQTVRWIHRVIHEHFTARRLAQLIGSLSVEEAWPYLRAAILHPSWSATLHQTGQLLFETRILHSLLDDLQRRAEERDTAEHLLSGGLAILTQYCTCRRRAAQVARFLAARDGYVTSAFKLDPESATEVLLADGFVPTYGAGWLFAQHPPARTLPLLEKLQQRDLLGPSFGGMEALWEARVAVDPHYWWPLAVQTARTTGEISLPSLFDWPADLVDYMVDELIAQMASGPGALSAYKLSRLGDRFLAEVANRPRLPQRLALAVAIDQYNNDGQRNYDQLVAQMKGPLHPEDIQFLAVDLELEVGWTHYGAQERGWFSVARVASYFGHFPNVDTWDLDPPLPITDLSLPLAEAIINAFELFHGPNTPGQIESFLWALCVLSCCPSARTLDTFLAWDEEDAAGPERPLSWESAGRWIDSNSLVAVKNSLDWPTLVAEARRDIAAGQRLGRAGGILAVAAEIWTSPRDVRPSDRHRLLAEDGLHLWLEGLTLQLQHGAGGFRTDRWHSLPEGASDESLIECAIAVLNLIDDQTGPIAQSARLGAERALAGVGALARLLDEVAADTPARGDPVHEGSSEPNARP